MSTTATEPPRLIADIGGTNARFALYDGAEYFELRVLACADYDSLEAAAAAYLDAAAAERPQPREAAIALACPVAGERIALTNHAWSISIDRTRAELGLDSLQAVNDFTALALALPWLDAGQRRQIGGGTPRPNSPLALLGPGTGLGVSGLIACSAGWLPLAGEGGHVTYGAADPGEAEIIACIRRRYPHVSAERLLSGPGLVNLYHAIAELDGVESEALDPAQVSARGLAADRPDPRCVAALNAFCAMLGTAAGNLVLTLGAQGGVYIGGGVVPRLGEFFDRSPFRQRFEQRGRFSAYLKAVPSYLITEPYATLSGVARMFDPFYRSVGYRSVAC